MSSTTPARADRATGLVLVCLGLAFAAGSYRMDRLTGLGIDPWTVPGLVPGILGAVLALLGAILVLRPARHGEAAPAPDAAEERSGKRLVWLALGMCLFYALVLVGLLPFWLATMLFVFAFTAALEYDPADPPASRARKLAVAGILAVATGAGIHLLFQELFLVRMP
jgi:hypothetical protein